MEQKSILVFGGGKLQESMVRACLSLGLYTIVLDPNPHSICSKFASLFTTFSSNEYDVAKDLVIKYKVSAIITAATDKPLVIMARIAKEFKLRFFSTESAVACTDKFLMKQYFANNNIPYARGHKVSSIEQIDIDFPLILKPRDNSGSRGVFFCEGKRHFEKYFIETMQFTKMNSVLVEEYIDGKEYSVESLHTGENTKIIQITEKKTTPFPYNVELGHFQPANLSDELKNEIYNIVKKIAEAFNFIYCASHTELKVSSNGIKVIETSPRLGGDFITSELVPLSTGIDIEKCLIRICLGEFDEDVDCIQNNVSGVEFFELRVGSIQKIGDLTVMKSISGVKEFEFSLKDGDRIPKITSSIDRYGYVIIQAKNRKEYLDILTDVNEVINNNIKVE